MEDSARSPWLLVVEDEEDIRWMMVEWLTGEGFEVSTAEHGGRAIELLEALPSLPFAIVLDLWMPIVSGFRFLELMRAAPRFAAIPVIICTASDERPAGVWRIFSKPVPLDALLAELRSLVPARPRPAGVTAA